MMGPLSELFIFINFNASGCPYIKVLQKNRKVTQLIHLKKSWTKRISM